MRMRGGDAVSAGLAGLTTFSGRASRAAYWWWMLSVVIVFFVVNFVLLKSYGMAQSFPPSNDFNDSGFQNFMMLLAMRGLALQAIIYLAWVAIQVRRLHDLNRSGYWVLLVLIPACIAMGNVVRKIVTHAMFLQAQDPLDKLVQGSSLILFAGTILLLVFNCTKGNMGDNRYGPPPVEYLA